MSDIPPPKKLDFSKTILLSNFQAVPKDIERKPDELLKQELGDKARLCFASNTVSKFQCFAYTEEAKDGTVTKRINSMLQVPPYTEKLFEGSYIENVDEAVARYMFNHIIGYDRFFSCPCIIIRDKQDDVVDIVKYRPQREGYEHLPKYLQEKSKNKPKNRGEFFLYPFETEMSRIIDKEGYVFIGEGIKNAVNALIRSVPYISIESTSGINNDALIVHIRDLFKRGIKVFGAMDGDKAGEKAFDMLNTKLDFRIVNLLDFQSDMDFTDYLKQEQL